MWPEFRRLIVAGRPRVLFGEQVAHAGAWFDGVCDDLEALDYEVGAAVLPACSVGLDHARPRIYFAGHANGYGESVLPIHAEVDRLPRGRGDAGGVVPSHGLSDRMALSGFGNAIVPELAAVFIHAYEEARAAGAVVPGSQSSTV
jgi:hypothetical protein